MNIKKLKNFNKKFILFIFLLLFSISFYSGRLNRIYIYLPKNIDSSPLYIPFINSDDIFPHLYINGKTSNTLFITGDIKFLVTTINNVISLNKYNSKLKIAGLIKAPSFLLFNNTKKIEKIYIPEEYEYIESLIKYFYNDNISIEIDKLSILLNGITNKKLNNVILPYYFSANFNNPDFINFSNILESKGAIIPSFVLMVNEGWAKDNKVYLQKLIKSYNNQINFNELDNVDKIFTDLFSEYSKIRNKDLFKPSTAIFDYNKLKIFIEHITVIKSNNQANKILIDKKLLKF